MASTPSKAPPRIGVAGALAVLFAIMLALGAGHHHLAVSAGGNGGARVVPHVVGGTADPCQDKPDDHKLPPIRAPRSARSRNWTIDCGTWRDTVRQIVRDGGGRPTVRQMLRCILATIRRGTARRLASADSISWRWGSGENDIAVVVADLAGRISLVTAGSEPASAPWRACAQAARS